MTARYQTFHGRAQAASKKPGRLIVDLGTISNLAKITFLLLLLAGLMLSGAACNGGGGGGKGGGGEEPGGPGTGPPGPGLQIEVQSVTIDQDNRPQVEFFLMDAVGNALDLSSLDGNPSFILSWIDVDAVTGVTRYQGYVVRTVNGNNYTYNGVVTAPALASATQVGTDSGGTFSELRPGVYRYSFNTVLPVGYNINATHTLGAYATRNSRATVVNTLFHFVPSGAPVAETRELVVTANCNECHNPIMAHGGVRRETGLCILCHTDQTVDPETGESVQFSRMIHKIHRGANLHNLPYLIVGFRQSIHDFSDIEFPQDIRNCAKCHKDGADAERWHTNPTRAACGSCHDDVDFVTGQNHSAGIQQFTDQFCSACHRPEKILEFDNSVPGAHTVPYESSVNPRLALSITDVQNMTPGNQPSISFTISDRNGPVDITTLNRVAIVFAGPTTDYSQLISLSHLFNIQGGGSIGTLTTNAVGDYTFAPNGYSIPAGASGTWSIGLEARTNSLPTGDVSTSFGANNPIRHIDLASGILGGGNPQPRRAVVDESQCNKCHFDLRMHGNLRTQPEYCVLCHNLWTTDERRRPGLDPVANPPASIDFKFMIHRIHRGENLVNPYSVYGFGSTEHDFTEVRFPGDLRDCGTCHVGSTNLLPGPANRGATVVNIAGVPVDGLGMIRTPTMAACTGCHDSDSTLVHAATMSIINSPTDWGEACNTCHAEGALFSVSDLHARN